ncbi:2-aminoethylphosphonate--pyruvate transaminase [Paraburkholderia caffeinitolerans]|uniref:2-aminoethylphosphonate--pyruvate transaminase n=1 Tax=Paraburkholderia caffeinitolerans TaxID=1723730 RepID=A0A6J5GRI0_9BURK|nr:2-aminoethylphosphonate--pyruvate transaminase [Paraburkholderia caffeinitolerans]CAB3803312.1 2-aminoethylphosphonate--pyruvate transaminase [Paraburkholderia caffeinitolerans]
MTASSTSCPPATSETGDPLLLTPGPLTTSRTVKAAMVHDWGSRDANFIEINRSVLARLASVANGADDWVTVPMQGSGTFAVEAMLTTFVPANGEVLVLINGAYGKRAKRILEIAGRKTVVHETPEDTPPDLAQVEAILAGTPSITHVFTIHCETTSGILNPIAKIGALAHKYGKGFLVDSMSAFGALPLDVQTMHIDAVAASSNKCIEGVPGLGFVICRRETLKQTQGNATTLVLDLHEQWVNMEKTNQYRFTPPTHVIVAFHQALDEFDAEGGVAGRGARYRNNCRILLEGMRALGFKPLLPDALQAPIIVTFHMPEDPRFVFAQFYESLKARGYVIYPGKLTVADSFRIGCIGRIGEKEMRAALAAIGEVLDEMGVTGPVAKTA